MTELICAECAAATVNAALPIQARFYADGALKDIRSSNHIQELLEWAKKGAEFRDASGYLVGITADTQWQGTLICKFHAVYFIQEQRNIKKGFQVR